MDKYPKNLSEFEKWFSSDKDCIDYLLKIKWPNGFICGRCKSTKGWEIRFGLYECSACNHQESVTTGTIFHKSHKPLTLWFRAIWWLAGQKNGASALGLKRILELGSYKTAWTWLHKLRRAMITPGRDNLTGVIEVDETFYGGEKSGKRGRGAEGKTIVAIAVEDCSDSGIGRIRLSPIKDASANSLNNFIIENITSGSTIKTDDWQGYAKVKEIGYEHQVVIKNNLKIVHLIASLLKRWLLGTHQGAVSHEHLPYYLDEFTFRFNRRKSNHRGLLFMRLIENAVITVSPTYDEIKLNIRGKKPS